MRQQAYLNQSCFWFCGFPLLHFLSDIAELAGLAHSPVAVICALLPGGTVDRRAAPWEQLPGNAGTWSLEQLVCDEGYGVGLLFSVSKRDEKVDPIHVQASGFGSTQSW